ncbi:MAG: hypothetical protein KFF46_01820 [Desulfobacterales bacterium]|nr:hypothetical protein [Desulfobacterales bacterium]
MTYTVDPGLYAMGAPDENSPVLVTANYKLSFDRLRAAWQHRNAWILVLDTKGINVWCAAGKNTFGTNELVSRIQSSGLAKIVSHRKIILPQLAAPGVAAHKVKRACGFTVIYGPVEAHDLPAFMDNGMKATGQMRTKYFPMSERAVLIPMEFIPAAKWMAVLMLVFFLLGGVGFSGTWWADVRIHGTFAALMLAGGLVAGSVLTPLLLPRIPGRAFAAKGAIAGLLTSCAIAAALAPALYHPGFWAEAAGMALSATAAASYIGMNFTGASTYTSLSGVRREMRTAVPAIIGAAVLGLVLWGAARFMV